MANLFIIENNIAKPNVETLLISPYKEIWERDNSKDKERAIKEFTYIELMSSKKKSNPYAGYPEDTRHQKLKGMLFPEDKNWYPDNLVEQALADIVELQTEASPTYRYYMDNLAAAEKTREYIQNIDLNERTEKGIPVYKPKDVTSAIIDTEKVIQTLTVLKEKMEQELTESSRIRGNKTINVFEM